jgi:hypothetical protein
MTHASAEKLFDLILWLAGAGHFVILIASSQVPSRLRWKEDLAQLLPFNRKLLWVQGGFTVLTIIAFGTLTFALHREFLTGDRAAMGLACFIGSYWTIRILVDAFYFSHDDWPQGREFVIGHVLLTSLFVALGLQLLGPIRVAGVAKGQKLRAKNLSPSAIAAQSPSAESRWCLHRWCTASRRDKTSRRDSP